MIRVGRVLREAADAYFEDSPNGKYFYGILLRKCLLNVIGFHATERSGHTDMHELFWEQMIGVVHSPKHEKYQRLILTHGLIRRTMPLSVYHELCMHKPGFAVLIPNSFTSAARHRHNDERGSEDEGQAAESAVHVSASGRSYIHVDENEEKLIIRQLKSLEIVDDSLLENAASWLLQLGDARSRMRSCTGTCREYGRFTGAVDAGKQPAVRDVSDVDNDSDTEPVAANDCNAVLDFEAVAVADLIAAEGYQRDHEQFESLIAIHSKIVEVDFLGAMHLTSQELCYVFRTPHVSVANKEGLLKVLDMSNFGEETTVYHASFLFPHLFGALSKQDREVGLAGASFQRWTRSRQVTLPATLLPLGIGVLSKAEEKRLAKGSASDDLTDRKNVLRGRIADLREADSMCLSALVSNGEQPGAPMSSEANRAL